MVPPRIRIPVALCLLLPAFAFAGTQETVKLGAHLVPKPAKGSLCATAPVEGFACDGFQESSALVTRGDLATSYHQYFVLLDIEPTAGVAGVRFGVHYDDTISYFGYESCSDIEFPQAGWPASGTGATFTWNSETNCQRRIDPTDPQLDAAAPVCGFYVYAYGEGRFGAIVYPDPEDPYNTLVTDCAGVNSTIPWPCYMGAVGFGSVNGYQPCVDFIGPVEMTSWGRIKRFYGEVGGAALPGDM